MTAVLIDGHHMMYRCCFIPELQRLKTRDGIPTGPVFGFLRVLGATLRRLKATSCVVVWDVGKSAYRKEFYPAYKANRDDKEKPEALENIQEQIGITQEILPHLNVKQLALQGYEGDDLLYLLIKTLREMDEDIDDIIVVTEDKDLLQLVETDTKVYRPISDQLVDVDNFEEMTGITREYFVLRKALVGDKSDNIDGVRGVGEKTANKLITEAYWQEDFSKWFFDSGYTWLKAVCADHKTKTAKRVAENWETVERNVKLMDLTKFPFTKRDSRKARGILNSSPGALTPAMGLMKILGRYEFNEILNGFIHWVRPFRRLT